MTHHCHLIILPVLPCHEFHILFRRNLHLQRRLSTSSSFYFFFTKKSTALFPLFTPLWNSLLKRLPLLLFLFPHKPVALWPYFPEFLHLTLKNLVLVLFIYPEFNAKTLSYVSFYYLLLIPSYVFQNQHIPLLRSL